MTENKFEGVNEILNFSKDNKLFYLSHGWPQTIDPLSVTVENPMAGLFQQ